MWYLYKVRPSCMASVADLIYDSYLIEVDSTDLAERVMENVFGLGELLHHECRNCGPFFSVRMFHTIEEATTPLRLCKCGQCKNIPCDIFLATLPDNIVCLFSDMLNPEDLIEWKKNPLEVLFTRPSSQKVSV